jgi:hypothetical protein
MRLFLPLFLTFFAVGQQSQAPVPTPAKTVHNHQAKGNSKEKKPSSSDEATKQLASAINQLTAEIVARNQAQSRTPDPTQTQADWWTKANTISIPVFTLALTVLAFLQWRAMHRQANISDKQAGIAEKQNGIADKQREIAAEQLQITKTAEVHGDERYAEQITLAGANASAAKQSADAALQLAQATKRSVKLQENTQRQWVDLRDWHVYRFNATDPLDFGFNIANPTNLPLTLHGVVTEVDGKRIDEETPIMLITPNDPFPHSIGTSLTPEQEALYTRDALHFEIDCKIMFADSHNIHWIQEIGTRLLCGRAGKPIVAVRTNRLYESGVPGERGSRDVELPK